MGTLTKPPANILELPLAQRAEMVLKAAVEKVVEEHDLSARAGQAKGPKEQGEVVGEGAESGVTSVEG